MRRPDGTLLPGQGPLPGAGRPNQRDEFVQACRALTPQIIQVLTEILVNGERGADRLKAGEILLERGWGRPSPAPEEIRAVQESPLLAAIAQIALSSRQDAVKAPKTIDVTPVRDADALPADQAPGGSAPAQIGRPGEGARPGSTIVRKRTPEGA